MKYIKNERRSRQGYFNLEMLMIIAGRDNEKEPLICSQLAKKLKIKKTYKSKYAPSWFKWLMSLSCDYC